MTSQELILAGKNKVRYDSNLMTAYIGAFKSVFGHEPDCAGCTFNNDWTRFENAVNNGVQPQKIETMSETSFKLRDTSKIYSYDYTHENGRKLRARTFGYNMTEEFAQEYLTEGTSEETEGRKAEFKILPLAFREAVVSESNKDSEELENLGSNQTNQDVGPKEDKPLDTTIEIVLKEPDSDADSTSKTKEQIVEPAKNEGTEAKKEELPAPKVPAKAKITSPKK